jgi:hypothetical protein
MRGQPLMWGRPPRLSSERSEPFCTTQAPKSVQPLTFRIAQTNHNQ